MTSVKGKDPKKKDDENLQKQDSMFNNKMQNEVKKKDKDDKQSNTIIQ